MDNSITIDEGEQKIKGGKVVIRRLFTLSEDGDYETGTIKYNELFYDIDKSISVLGEEENEKWIIINKRDLKDIPSTDFLAYFHTLLKSPYHIHPYRFLKILFLLFYFHHNIF